MVGPRGTCKPGALVATATIAGIEAGTVAVDKAAAYSGILLRSFARLDAKKMPTAIAIGMAR